MESNDKTTGDPALENLKKMLLAAGASEEDINDVTQMMKKAAEDTRAMALESLQAAVLDALNKLRRTDLPEGDETHPDVVDVGDGARVFLPEFGSFLGHLAENAVFVGYGLMQDSAPEGTDMPFTWLHLLFERMADEFNNSHPEIQVTMEVKKRE